LIDFVYDLRNGFPLTSKKTKTNSEIVERHSSKSTQSVKSAIEPGCGAPLIETQLIDLENTSDENATQRYCDEREPVLASGDSEDSSCSSTTSSSAGKVLYLII
jgi:hypothetical protein